MRNSRQLARARAGAAYCALLVIWLFMAQTAPATTYMRVGVDSAILVAGERVFFAQADGSLTGLDLATGRVLLRKTSDDGFAMCGLTWTKYGLLVTGMHRAELFDKDTFASLWKSSPCHGSHVSDEFVVLVIWGGLECRDLRTGQPMWSYWPSDQLHDAIAASGKLLVKSGADDSNVTLTVLDAATGHELFKKPAPKDIPCRRAYFDGEQIYLARGWGGSGGPFDTMLIWNLSGREVGSLDLAPALRSGVLDWEHPFEVDGRVFHWGHVWNAARRASPSTSQGASSPQGGSEAAPGEARVTTDLTRQQRERFPTVAVELGGFTWRGFLPCAEWGRICTFAQAGDKLLLGTDTGQVECVDIRTGRSIWIYVFLTESHMVTYSSGHGRSSYLADRAKAFHNRPPLPSPKGLCLLPAGKTFEEVDLSELAAKTPTSPGPAVIFDPQPVDRYTEVPLYLAKAWTGVLAPTVFLGAILLLSRRRRWGWRVGAFAGLVAAGVITVVMYFYGSVSLECTLAAKGMIVVMTILTGYYLIRAFEGKRRGATAILIVGIIALVLFAFPVLRYA